jgi:hypothetical protein
MTTPPDAPLAALRERFLARVVEHGFESGLRTPPDFVRHFSPVVLMGALAAEPDRRARILQDTIGLRPRIALKKSPRSSGEDLQIALDEGETDAATLVRLFPPADAARFLAHDDLWAYVVEPSHVGGDTPPEAIQAIRSHTAFIIDAARTEGIISGRDIIGAIGIAALVERLPRPDIATVLERALEDGRQGIAFSDDALLELVPLEHLVAHVPLATLWTWVIAAKIAAPLGLSEDIEGPAVPLDVAEPDELLFDETEAHPDASTSVTVMIDPAGTEPQATIESRADDHQR